MKRACHAVLLGLLFAVPAATAAPPVCTPTGEGQMRCAITRVSDCNALKDYPYARNLFCPAAFRAVQDMLAKLSQDLGTAGPATGFFYYYQTLADDTAPPDQQAQTKDACLETKPQFGDFFVKGAGVPLCHLLAYSTSVGPGAPPDASSGNPVPSPLRGFPGYFLSL